MEKEYATGGERTVDLNSTEHSITTKNQRCEGKEWCVEEQESVAIIQTMKLPSSFYQKNQSLENRSLLYRRIVEVNSHFIPEEFLKDQTMNFQFLFYSRELQRVSNSQTLERGDGK
ncbi:hypothetical protein L1987_22691 [Smallanthus sonchifolius]|uniref:Uncharacterized protein n=1 Tax=Smallanthus sonchifolius TaxID=185202 RepID=A0ACB9IGZ8_9ASTR|nr:hypothetical protein L1987_22691 [Smallanthus sonchifolius]